MKTFSFDPDGHGLRHLSATDAAERASRFGTFSLDTTDPVVAGSDVRLELRFTCGDRPMEVGDTLGLAWRLPCDWGDLQIEDPAAANFASAHAPPEVELRLAYRPRGGVKPWHHVFMATLVKGHLASGDEVRFVLGDRSGGSTGWTCQRAATRSHRFLAMVRKRSEKHWLELPGMDAIEVASGVAASLSVVAPSDCRCGEPLEITARLVDRYGNPSTGLGADARFESPGLIVRTIERIQRSGRPIDVWRATVTFDGPGRYRVKVRHSASDMEAESNPIDCRVDAAEERLVWGDLHAGQSDMGCGQGSLEDFFWYARHVAGLQFVSHQPNDVYVTRWDWDHARRLTERAHEPEAGFVAFHGCEWTALPSSGGDRNVFYLADRPVLNRAGRWYSEDEPDAWEDAVDPEELYACLGDTQAVINLHAGGFTSELAWMDAGLERLVEIHSTHGTSDWLVAKALEQGRTFGISAGTDGIMGRPGACVPGSRQTRNVPNGCLGVYSRSVTRDDLWRSIRARRCYATDGERIRLVVKLGAAFMGEELTTDALPPLTIDVAGTAAIERLIVRRDGDVVCAKELWEEDREHPNRYRLDWCGTRAHGSSHAQALEWTGRIRPSRGRLALVGGVGFYCEEDALTTDGEAIFFRSVTAGNRVGFLFDAPDGEGERVSLESNLVTTEFALQRGAMVRHDLPPQMGSGVVTLSRAPDPNGCRDRRLEIELGDTEPSGRHAYWVEVVQVDGRRAWSSPIYVTSRRSRVRAPSGSGATS